MTLIRREFVEQSPLPVLNLYDVTRQLGVIAGESDIVAENAREPDALQRVAKLRAYQRYCNEARTHLSLHKDAPVPRKAQAVGRVVSVPILGGLNHQYVRI